MSEEAEATVAAKPLNANKIRRRVEKFAAGDEPRLIAKQKKKLAATILRQIAAGQIKNPVAAAKAFVEASSKVVGKETDTAEG